MPLYDYACTKCGRTVEVRHGFDETHEQPCATCGAPVRRVFNAAPVLFKGSGFYVTDSRRSPSPPKPEKKSDAGGSPADAAAKSDAAAPAPAKSEGKAADSAA